MNWSFSRGGIVTLQVISPNCLSSSQNPWGIDDIKHSRVGKSFSMSLIPIHSCANFTFMCQKCSMVGDPPDVIFFLPHPIVPSRSVSPHHPWQCTLGHLHESKIRGGNFVLPSFGQGVMVPHLENLTRKPLGSPHL